MLSSQKQRWAVLPLLLDTLGLWPTLFVACNIANNHAANANREWSNVDPGLEHNGTDCVVRGWVAGPNYSGPALPVQLRLDGVVVANSTASVSRKVAGNHGFEIPLACSLISTGFHRLGVFGPALVSLEDDGAQRAPNAWSELTNSPVCTFYGDYEPSCTAPPPGPAPAPVPHGQVCSSDLPFAQTQDCNGVEGRYACSVADVWPLDATAGQGVFGFCQKSPLNASLMRCCRLSDPNHEVGPLHPSLLMTLLALILTAYTCIAVTVAAPKHVFFLFQSRPPAPMIPPPKYPPPASNRPSTLDPLPNVVLILTDDEDVQLGSLDVMNRTKALLREGALLQGPVMLLGCIGARLACDVCRF